MADEVKWNLFSVISDWPLSRKISLAAVVLFSLTLFAILILQARQVNHQMLFANLSESDASAIVVWLKDNKIPYELRGNGNSIYIPAEMVHETRLQLTSSGLPQGGGVGFEIFDKQSLGITDFVQKVNYQRALQGELARTVASLAPVEAARVHLALTEKRLFKNQQQKSTASIVLRMVPGQRLKDDQVQGIVNLVAGSVEGLDSAYVSVMDTTGKELSKRPEEGLDGPMTPGMLEYQRAVERHLEKRAQELLDRALGPANSLVKVTATLDFAQKEKIEELYDPKTVVPRSEQISEQKNQSSGGVGGVPGVEANLGDPQIAYSASGGSGSSSAETTNYEISKVINRMKSPVGIVSSLSVSVLVGEQLSADLGSEAQRDGVSATARTDREIEEIRKMVQSAIGIDPSRGDQITVTSMALANQFYTSPEIPALTWNDRIVPFAPLLKYAAMGLGVMLLYLLVLRPALKTLQGESTTQHMKTVKELEAEMAAGRSNKTQLDPAEQIRQDILKAENSPAQAIRSWISDNE
ncbi:MAG: flagellar basal-body MS-ring/collar protein FliF [Desulfuromonadaceae bacterium]|nr:flagellar basal-body MS-ring/collar protein FliF [Desulfuromonadaceae bacterium]